MTKEQKRIASNAIADVVRNAMDTSRERPTKKELRRLAKATASAMAVGFKRLNSAD